MGEPEDTIKMNFFIKEAQAVLDKAKAIADKYGKSFDFEGNKYSGKAKQFVVEDYWMGSGNDSSCY